MIELYDVSKSYQGVSVLSGLSLSVKGGEVVGLLGESGSGKSTILGIISSLVEPDCGEVNVHSSNIGYIFQSHCLLPWRTALENVMFPLTARGVHRTMALRLAYRALERVELGGFEQHYPAQLSGGMCQRVSIARAFVLKPDILLMDEPFSALDSLLKTRMTELLKSLLEKSPAAVIYVTHNPEELEGLASRVYELKQRRLYPISQE